MKQYMAQFENYIDLEANPVAAMAKEKGLLLLEGGYQGNAYEPFSHDGIKRGFVIIVGALVAVQIVLQLGLQPTVGGLSPVQIGILSGIGGRADGPHKAVANRHHRGHTRLREHQQQKTGKEQQHPPQDAA